MEDVYNLPYIAGFIVVTTLLASAIIITFIAAVSVASLAYCNAVADGRPEEDGHNIVIAGQSYC